MFNPRIQRLERIVKEGGGGGSVPTPTAEDVGKVPVVNQIGEYELEDMPQNSLPSYTSDDKGKFLGLGEGEESETIVIVPEQTVTTGTSKTFFGANGYYAAEISEGDFSGVSVGDSVILTVDGTDYQCIAAEVSNDLVIETDPVAYGVAVGSNWAIFLSATGKSTTYTISVSKSVPKIVPKWESDKVVITSSNAALSHLQTKIGAAFTSFFTSATNVKYYDRTSNVLTDDDLTNITTVYSALSEGNTNVVLSSIGVLFPVASSSSDNATFVLPYYGQSYSTIIVAARITILLSSTKDVVVIAEKLYDSRA